MNAKNQPEMESFDAAELGAMMREMRENLGHDLDAVARDLRIRLVYLEAIESGRLADLPGNAYVSGFLRSYSDFLGLEGEEIVRRFKMAGAEISNQPQLHLPSPVEEGRLPTASILLVAAVIAAAAYGGWYYLSGSGKGPMETVASLPKELSGLVDGAKNQTAPIEVAKSPAPPAAASDTGNTVAQTTDAAATETPALGNTPETVATAQPAETSSETPSGPTSPENPVVAAQPAAEPVPAAQTPEAENNAPTPVTTSDPPTETATATAEQSTAPVSAPEATERAPAPAPVETPTAAAIATPTVPPSTAAVESRPAETVTAAAPEPAARTTAPPAATNAAAAADDAVRTAAVAPSSAPSSNPSSTPSPASVAPTPAPRSETVPAVPSDSAPAQTASRSSSDTDSAASSTEGGVRIVVRAIADSYVAVRTSDNQPLFSQLMRRGDSYEVPSGADLVLETGNAGGLQITVGGKRVPALGPVGEIRRNIPMDAEKLLRGIN